MFVRTNTRVPSDTPEFPAYSQVFLRNYNGQLYSYGRPSLGLRFQALTRPLDLPVVARLQILYIHFRVSRILCF